MRCFASFALSRTIKVVLGFVSAISLAVNAAAQEERPGLAATFTVDALSDTATLSNVWLRLPENSAPTPFLPPGKAQVTWRGFISAELRSDFTFAADLNGVLKLEINGATALEGSAENGSIQHEKTVRLNKGTNALVATFTGPASGDAFVRLRWIPKDGPPGPVPSGVLTHLATEDVEKGRMLRLGRQVALEHRCFHCHSDARPQDKGIPELTMDAPSFEGIGSRRHYSWMAAWIEHPHEQRPRAQMPKVFHGAQAKADAQAAAAYLASLKAGGEPAELPEPRGEQLDAGAHAFNVLHCVACHNPPDVADEDPAKISLRQVAAKFTPNSLISFLKNPAEHYQWIKMPDFKLTDDEAFNLASFLISKAPAAEAQPAPEASGIERGKLLVQNSGCLNCHAGPGENQFKAPANLKLDADRGCLAVEHAANSKAPTFDLTTEERTAVRAFLATDRSSLQRHVPQEFATRHSNLLNCAACHGKFEGFPAFDILGGKLKPEWSADFIAGKVNYKPRPWIEARMPAFNKYAEAIAQGLALQHGFPAQTPEEPPIDQEAAKVGQRLVSAVGGFACVSCHSVGEFGATAVFEAPGINLAHSGERLQHDFFHRWVANPLAIDPSSKMPVYFDNEGNSPLTEVYEGSAQKQIEAMWQYVRMGEKMPPPPIE